MKKTKNHVKIKTRAGRPKLEASGLPTWFKIEKYRGAKNFTIRQWYESLAIRFAILEYPSGLIKKYRNPFNRLKPFSEVLRNAPLLGIQDYEDTIFKVPDSKGMVAASNFYLYLASIVSTANNSAAFYNFSHRSALVEYNSLSDSYKNYSRCASVYYGLKREEISLQQAILQISSFQNSHDILKSKNRDDILQRLNDYLNENEKQSNQYMAEQVSSGLLTPIYINLDVSDQYLKKSFPIFIKKLRTDLKNKNTKFVIRPSDISTWYKYGLLAYLDIAIWQKESDQEIPNLKKLLVVELGSINPDAVGVEVIKTTQLHAEKLMSHTGIETLRSYAYLESCNSKIRKKV
jgi:Family of unknown function (DUF6387)